MRHPADIHVCGPGVSHHFKCDSVPAKRECLRCAATWPAISVILSMSLKTQPLMPVMSRLRNLMCPLPLTEEQRLAIIAFFQRNNWNYTETTSPEQAVPPEDDLDPEPGYVLPQDPDATDCVFCLCRVCIMDALNQQLWWQSESQEAHERNSVVRKGSYKHFWTVLFHRGAWLDPRCKQKKADAFQQDHNRQHYVWGGGKAHKCDIMPDYVLQCVRSWYRNPPSLQHMGHHWGYWQSHELRHFQLAADIQRRDHDLGHVKFGFPQYIQVSVQYDFLLE